ncbi:unnamed protein product [Sphagnum jensenii]|uniref:Uncharacterized protein n=1 Tax=Sphagnum jensenii TaxID=128206 RepID=A0ABP0VEE0_9BRYO
MSKTTVTETVISICLFIFAGIAEIGGGLLIWKAVRENYYPAYLIPAGAVVLICYGFIPTLQPTGDFGRIFAVYGGFFIVLSYVFGYALDGLQVDKGDFIGCAIALVGVAIGCDELTKEDICYDDFDDHVYIHRHACKLICVVCRCSVGTGSSKVSAWLLWSALEGAQMRSLEGVSVFVKVEVKEGTTVVGGLEGAKTGVTVGAAVVTNEGVLVGALMRIELGNDSRPSF